MSQTETDSKFSLLMGLWRTAIVGWALLTLVMLVFDNGSLRQERRYLRDRLFVEMNLRAEVQRTVDLQNQTHALYEAEIALLKRQAEMIRVERVIGRINRRLDERTRWQIVNAAYSCAEAVGLEPLFVLAVMEQESSYNPRAISSVGARGLMQLMPRTAASLGVPRHQIYNIDLNVCAGAAYLAKHLQTYNGARTTALQRYYGGGTVAEYASPILTRYARLRREAGR